MLKQRQTQRATRGLRWLKIYMALTTTLLCKNMSNVRLKLMLRQRQTLKQRQRLRQRLTLKQRQTQRATHGLGWLEIYMALTTTLLCENMSSVMLMLMLSQLGLCKTTAYTQASEDDGFSKKINKRKLSDEHCKAGKTKNSNANDHEINTIVMNIIQVW